MSEVKLTVPQMDARLLDILQKAKKPLTSWMIAHLLLDTAGRKPSRSKMRIVSSRVRRSLEYFQSHGQVRGLVTPGLKGSARAWVLVGEQDAGREPTKRSITKSASKPLTRPRRRS